MRFLYSCFIALLLLIPLYGMLALFVVLDSGFPIFYRQKRQGQGVKSFFMIKFRTMRRDAEAVQKKLFHLNEANGPVFKIRDDPRYTRIGKVLAHSGLDEVPQLWNVLRGDMALIGPRPLPVVEAAKLKPWQHERNAGKPGIISPWIIEGYHSQSFDTWMKSDIAYLKRKSFLYDMQLAGKAIWLLCMLFVKECLHATHVGKHKAC